jgi:hypothetical protein
MSETNSMNIVKKELEKCNYYDKNILGIINDYLLQSKEQTRQKMKVLLNELKAVNLFVHKFFFKKYSLFFIIKHITVKNKNTYIIKIGDFNYAYVLYRCNLLIRSISDLN